MKSLTLAMVGSTRVYAVFLLTKAFLWLVLSLCELFLVFLPINNTQQKQRFLLLFYLQREKYMQMTNKFLQVRNEVGQIVSIDEFEQQQDQLPQSPALYMYEMLRSLCRRQSRYPFQLIKQYFLFPDDDSDSIEVNYKHMRHQVELAVENVRSVSVLLKQRHLIDGFISIKNLYLHRRRVEDAYYNVQNIVKLHIHIIAVENARNVQLKWEGFSKLVQNLKSLKLSKINLSKIDIVSNDFTSKELEDFNPFFEKGGREIEVVHSYIIDRSSENQQDSSDLGREHFKKEIHQDYHLSVKRKIVDQENQNKLISSRHRDKNNYEGAVELKFNDIKNKRQVGINVGKEKQKESRQREQDVGVRSKISNHSAQTEQQIYLIRDYRSKTKTPSNYIKIPVTSQNIKIVQIDTGRKRKHRKTIQEELRLDNSVNACQNCKYCMQVKQRRQIMKRLQQKINQVNQQSSHRHDFVFESTLKSNRQQQNKQIEVSNRLIDYEKSKYTNYFEKDIPTTSAKQYPNLNVKETPHYKQLSPLYKQLSPLYKQLSPHYKQLLMSENKNKTTSYNKDYSATSSRQYIAETMSRQFNHSAHQHKQMNSISNRQVNTSSKRDGSLLKRTKATHENVLVSEFLTD